MIDILTFPSVYATNICSYYFNVSKHINPIQIGNLSRNGFLIKVPILQQPSYSWDVLP